MRAAQSRRQGRDSSQGCQATRGGYRVERAGLTGVRGFRGAGVAEAGDRPGVLESERSGAEIDGAQRSQYWSAGVAGGSRKWRRIGAESITSVREISRLSISGEF